MAGVSKAGVSNAGKASDPGRPGEPTMSDRLAAARAGTNPQAIGRVASGFATMCDRQFPRGWCVLIPDPAAPTLNDLDAARRAGFLADMARLGDAVLAATGCARINYAIYGNQVPQLHAHVVPRYADEDEAMRAHPVWLYPRERLDGRPFNLNRDQDLMRAIRDHLDA